MEGQTWVPLGALSGEYILTRAFPWECNLEQHLFSIFLIELLISWGGFELFVVNDTFVSKLFYVKSYFNVPRR